MKKKLTLSSNKMIGGVCGGLAEYFDLDPTLFRVLYAVAPVTRVVSWCTWLHGMRFYLRPAHALVCIPERAEIP